MGHWAYTLKNVNYINYIFYIYVTLNFGKKIDGCNELGDVVMD